MKKNVVSSVMERTPMKYLVVVLVLFTVGIQSTFALTMEARMQSFFNSKNELAFKCVSKFAHPTNVYKSGNCEVYGDYVYVTVFSRKHATQIRLHKSGSRFDDLEVVSDTDTKYCEAFKASNFWKNVAVDYLREKYPNTFRNLENTIGCLNDLTSKQICLAVLSYLYWQYPG